MQNTLDCELQFLHIIENFHVNALIKKKCEILAISLLSRF